MSLKKAIFVTAAALSVALGLCGCTYSYDGQGVARFVSPEAYGAGVIPAEAPSVKEGKKEVINEALSSDTIFTVNARYEIDESYFVHEEFNFMIPTGWQGHLIYTSKEVILKDHVVRSMDFFYRVPQNADVLSEDDDPDVRLMQIECVDSALLAELDIYANKEKAGESSDGRYSYYITYYENLIPGEKPYSAACVNILGTMMSERGKINIKC